MTPSAQPFTISRGGRRALLAASAAAAALGWAIDAQALPAGGSVESGAAAIATGTKEVDVTQTSQRAVIDWDSFNLSADEKIAFDQKLGASSITFNRVSVDSFTTIAGSVTAQGGVWIFSPAGLIIGPSARINVGSFVASTGDLTENTRCGDTFCDGSPPEGGPPILTDTTIEMIDGTAPITVQSGAVIDADNGFVVFNSENITQNGSVTATDGVAYVLADDTSLTITDDNETGPAQQLVSVDVSDSFTTSASLTHGGSTKGSWIGVIGVTGNESAGDVGDFSGVINLSGVMQATGIAPFQPDSTTVALLGTDGFPATPFAGANISFGVDASAGTLTADQGGVYLSGGEVLVGNVNAQQSLLVGAQTDVEFDGVTKVAGEGYVSALGTTFKGDTTIDGGLTVDTRNLAVASGVTIDSKGSIDITGDGDFTFGAGSTVRAASGGSTDAELTISGINIDADPTSTLAAGKVGATPSGNVSVTGAGGTVSVGAVSGKAVLIAAIEGEGAPAGDVTVAGPVVGSKSVLIEADVASTHINGDVTSAGTAEIDAEHSVTVGPGVTIRSDSGGTGAGGVTIDAGDELTADVSSVIVAGKTGAAPTDTVDLNGPTTMTLGQVAGTDVTLTTNGDLTLDGNITATHTLTVDPANVFINADLTVGGDINLTADDTIAVNTGVKVSAGGNVDLESGNVISLAANSSVRADSGGAGGTVFLESPTIDADPTSLIAAGPVTGPPGGAVTVYADGGDLKAGGVSGTAVLLNARGPQSDGGDGGDSGDGPPPPPPPPPLPGGDLIIGGPVVGTTSVTGLSDFGAVAVNADVTGGAVDIEAETDLTVAAGVTIMADKAGLGGDLFLGAGGDITADATSNLQGGASASAPTGPVLVEAGGDITVGKVSGTTVELTTTGDVETDGAVFGSQSVAIDPFNVDINADMTSGGTIDITADNAVTIAGGVKVTAADHTFITAATISAGAGATIQSDSDGDGVGAVDLEADSIAASGASIIGGGSGLTGAVTVNASNGAIDVGVVKGSVVDLTGTGAVTLFGAQTAGTSYSATSKTAGIEAKAKITSGGAIALSAATTLALDDGAGLSAAGPITGTAGIITVGKNAGIQSDSGGLGGARGVTLEATSGDLTIDPTSSVFAGASAAAPTAPVTLTSDLGKLGLGPVAGSNVTLTSASDLSLGSGVLATQNLAATSTAGRIDVASDLTAGADMDLKAKTGLGVAANHTVKAGGHLNATAPTMTVAAGDVIQADSAGKGAGTGVNLHTTGDLTADPTSSIFAGTTAAAPTAAVTLTSDNGALGLGQVAGTNVTLSSANDLTLGAGVLATGALSATSAGKIAVADNLASGGDTDLNAKTAITVAANKTVKAGGHLNATAATITLAAGDVVQSDSGGAGGARGVNLHATGAVTADPSSQVFAGATAGAPTSTVTITSDNAALGLGQVAGTDVTLASAGNLTLGAGILATGALKGTSTGGAVGVKDNLTSGGDTDLKAASGLTVAGGKTVKAGGHLNATATTITVAAGDVVQSDSAGQGGARGVNLHATGALTADPTSQIFAGTSVTAPTSTIALTSDTDALSLGRVAGTNVTLSSANDLTLNSTILATGVLSATSTTGQIVVADNVTSGGDMDLTAKTTLGVAAGKTIKAGGHLNANAATITLAASDIVQSDSAGQGGAHGVNLHATGGVTADPTSQIFAGTSVTAPSSTVALTSDIAGLSLGRVAGTDVTLLSAADLTLGSTVLATGALSATSTTGQIVVADNVTSGGDMDLTAKTGIGVVANKTLKAGGHLNANAATITLAAGDVVQSDSGGLGGARGATLHATGAVTADPTSQVFAGVAAGAPTSAVTITSDTAALGLGQVAGTDVTLTSAGDLTLGAGILATGALKGTSTGGAIGVKDNLTSGGDTDLSAKNGLTVAGGKTVKAGGHLNATAATITMAAGDVLQSDSGGRGGARGVNLHAGGAITANPTSQVFAGGAITTPTAAVTLTSDTGGVVAGRMAGTAVTVTAPGDVTLAGAVLATTSITVDPANIAVNANLTSGGTIDLTATKAVTVASGVTISAADHVNVTAASIAVAAGDLVQSDSDGNGAGALSLHATGGDVTVGAGGQLLAGNTLGGGTAALSAVSDAGALTLGAVGGKDVTLTSAADLTLTGAVQATGALTATSTGGAVAVQDNVSSGGAMTLAAKTNLGVAANKSVQAGGALTGSAATITLAAGDVVQSDAGGAGGRGLTLTSTGAFTADATSALIAGAKSTAPTSAVTVSAGGNGVFGQVSGTNVTLTSVGDTTLGGAVFGSQSVFVDPGNLHVAANVSSGGSIALIADSGGALTIDPNIAVTSAGGPVYLAAGQDISLGAGAQVSGGAMDVVAGGTLHLASGSGLTTTGTSTAPSWPILPNTVTVSTQSPVPTFTGMNIAASGFDLQGAITAGPVTARDDIYIQVLGTPTLVSVGGADTTSGGVRLSNSAISHMSGRNLIVMAGAGEGAGSNANIEVDDLTIDSSKLSGLALGTSSDRTISVPGQVSVAGSGPVDLHLGFTRNAPGTRTDPNGSTGALQGFIPGEIDITGGLGSETAPFHATVLLARNNIFMGSADFIAAAKADPNFDAVKSSPLYDIEYGHVLVASHDLELGAQGRIIQQNTKGAFRYAGLVIDSPTNGHALTAAPSSLEGRTIGTGSGAWTAHYALGPSVIDVFGVLTRPDGSVAVTVDAALEPNLADPSIALRDSYRINTCVFSSHCVAAAPPMIQVMNFPPGYLPLPPTDIGDDLQVDDTNDDERQKNGVPITQSGNGDLWVFPSGPPTH